MSACIYKIKCVLIEYLVNPVIFSWLEWISTKIIYKAKEGPDSRTGLKITKICIKVFKNP